MKKEKSTKWILAGRSLCFMMTVLTFLMLSGIDNNIKAQETCALTLSDAQAAAGITTTLNVALTSGSGFNAMQLVFAFDAQKLEYQVPAGAAQAKGDVLKTFETANSTGTLVINSNQVASGLLNMGYI